MHLLQRPKSRTLGRPDVGRDGRSRSSRSLLGGMQARAATLENSATVSYKTTPPLYHKTQQLHSLVFPQLS